LPVIFGLFGVLVLLMWLLLLVVMVLLVLGVVLVMVVMALDPGALALSPSPLLLVVSSAQAPAVFFVPGAQRLAAKGEIVVFDDGGDHPWVVGEVDFAHGGVCDVEVRNEEVGLGHPI